MHVLSKKFSEEKNPPLLFSFKKRKKNGFIFGSFVFLRAIIVARQHGDQLGFQVWVPAASDNCLTYFLYFYCIYVNGIFTEMFLHFYSISMEGVL